MKGSIPITGEASGVRKCPACHEVVMLKYRDSVSALEIDSCPECYGLWFDSEELKLFFQSPSLSQQILEEDAAENLLVDESDVGRENTTRMCPVCDDQPLFGSRIGATQVDYCLRCRGIWLDRAELEAVVRAYQSGERGNILIINQLAEGLGTPSNPNPRAEAFIAALKRYLPS